MKNPCSSKYLVVLHTQAKDFNVQQIFAIAMVDKTISMIVPKKIAEIPSWYTWYHAEVLSPHILSFFQGHALEEGLRWLWQSFYNDKYGSSVITSKVSQNISVMKNINTGVSVVFKTKCELKCQNKLFFWKH